MQAEPSKTIERNAILFCHFDAETRLGIKQPRKRATGQGRNKK